MAFGGPSPIQLGIDLFFESAIPLFVWLSKTSSMDNKGILEFRRILWRLEEIIQSNMSSLVLVKTKMHKNKHHFISQHANIMTLMVHKKQRIEIL